MARRKPKKRKQAYFICRESHIDESRFLNDEGRRVYFDKPEHARWLMANFKTDQNAKLVYGPVLEGDITYRQLLEEVWLVGTGVTVLGIRGPVYGMIDLYLDGEPLERVDLFASATGLQQTLYETDGLPPGEHTLAAVISGSKNPLSGGVGFALDAFDVRF